MEMVTWECDYPHSDTTWPTSPETLVRYLDDVPRTEIDAVTHGNAMRLFSFDPSSHRDRNNCTVGGAAVRGAWTRHLHPLDRTHVVPGQLG